MIGSRYRGARKVALNNEEKLLLLSSGCIFGGSRRRSNIERLRPANKVLTQLLLSARGGGGRRFLTLLSIVTFAMAKRDGAKKNT